MRTKQQLYVKQYILYMIMVMMMMMMMMMMMINNFVLLFYRVAMVKAPSMCGLPVMAGLMMTTVTVMATLAPSIRYLVVVRLTV